MRWTITPMLLPVLIIINLLLLKEGLIYEFLLAAQVLFYVTVLAGWVIEKAKRKVKLIIIPYYFFIMNYAVYRGFLRYIQKNQSVNWERAKRG
ncbi:MAG: hypothetical protein K9H49_19370 [Bacteroidales bacterium]|nr:hypothetical protein [Bacteroidales bacterium]MCF8391864.1 hypothetical protein [Bacteroidales bacterium]